MDNLKCKNCKKEMIPFADVRLGIIRWYCSNERCKFYGLVRILVNPGKKNE